MGGLACMMASTVFFFLRLPSFSERYKPALCYTGLVTFIAFYHYIRIFNSFDSAFAPCAVEDGVMNYAKCDPELGYMSTGHSSTRWTYWTLSMLPFCYIVYTLFVGLKESQ